jgi:hypothetical protein
MLVRLRVRERGAFACALGMRAIRCFVPLPTTSHSSCARVALQHYLMVCVCVCVCAMVCVVCM